MTLPASNTHPSRRRRFLSPVVVAIIVAVPLLPLGPPAAGQSSQSQLDRIRTELRDAKTDAAKNERLLEQVEREIRAAERRLDQAREEEKDAKAEREEADRLAELAREDIERLRRHIGVRARAIYMTGGAGQFDVLTGSESPEEMLERVLRLDSIAREDNRVMPDLRKALELVQGAQERIRLAEQRRAEAVEAIKARAAELRETRDLREEAQERLDQRIEKYREDIVVILRESAQLRSELAVSSGSGNVGKLLRPVGCTQTSGFGPRWGRMHEGIDYGCGLGTPVKAAKDGLVIKAGWSSGYGNLVAVDHGDGVATVYAHNSRFAVEVGDEVSAGQVIAYSGNTGRSTGPHVHFEVRINGVPRNPAQYL